MTQDQLLKAFNGRRVLVTGHTGFKGGWLAFWLHQLGAEVAGYATDPPSTPSFFELTDLRALLTRDVRSDLRDFEALQRQVRDFAPEMIFHLGAQALVPTAAKAPRETFEVNFMGTVNLLEAARETPEARGVVVVTSDKCYQAAGAPPEGYREGSPLGGDGEPYSASKAAAEIAAAVYQHRDFLEIAGGHVFSVATARAGNVIGGGDYADHRLVPDLVRAIDHGGLTLRNPVAIRPWQHVLSADRGYLELGARLLAGEDVGTAWNFGPGPEGEVPVRDLVESFHRQWPEASFSIERAAERLAVETPTLRLDTAKAREELGWHPVWTLDETVAATVEWYRAARDGAGAETLRSLSAQQIDRFLSASP